MKKVYILQADYDYRTIEETHAYEKERLLKSIRECRWVIEECEFVC